MAGADHRPEEERARRMEAAATGLRVEAHDDGSSDGMYDLGVFDGAARVGAVEVPAAADTGLIEL